MRYLEVSRQTPVPADVLAALAMLIPRQTMVPAEVLRALEESVGKYDESQARDARGRWAAVAAGPATPSPTDTVPDAAGLKDRPLEPGEIAGAAERQQWTTKIAGEVAERMGYAGPIEVRGGYAKARIGETTMAVMGEFNPKDGIIHLYPKAMRGIGNDDASIEGGPPYVLAHEIGHAIFQAGFREPDYASGEGGRLQLEDGVTPYSTSYWYRAFDGKAAYTAASETFAEITAGLSMGKKLPDFVKPTWQKFYRDIVDRARAKGTVSVLPRGLREEEAKKGDLPGHPFRGNQYASGAGGVAESRRMQLAAIETLAEYAGRAEMKRAHPRLVHDEVPPVWRDLQDRIRQMSVSRRGAFRKSEQLGFGLIKYDPDQPRDERGRFGSGGAGGAEQARWDAMADWEREDYSSRLLDVFLSHPRRKDAPAARAEYERFMAWYGEHEKDKPHPDFERTDIDTLVRQTRSQWDALSAEEKEAVRVHTLATSTEPVPALDSALSRITLTGDVELRRATDASALGLPAGLTVEDAMKLRGTEITERGYGSATASEESISGFLRPGRVILDIEAPKGTHAIPIGDDPERSTQLSWGESEVMLPRDTSYRVLGAEEHETESGKRYVRLRVRVSAKGIGKGEVEGMAKYDPSQEPEHAAQMATEAERLEAGFRALPKAIEEATKEFGYPEKIEIKNED